MECADHISQSSERYKFQPFGKFVLFAWMASPMGLAGFGSSGGYIDADQVSVAYL
jgi:hypothetical protein